MTATDESWRDVAYASREALRQLGFVIGPRCLPDEPDACGGGYADHSAAHFAALGAVIDHQLGHLQPPAQLLEAIYRDTKADLIGGCQAPIACGWAGK